jgi:hypothetical protein
MKILPSYFILPIELAFSIECRQGKLLNFSSYYCPAEMFFDHRGTLLDHPYESLFD